MSTYRLHDHEGADLGLLEHPAPNVEPGDVVVLADGREALSRLELRLSQGRSRRCSRSWSRRRRLRPTIGTSSGDDPELASYLRIEERELDAGDHATHGVLGYANERGRLAHGPASGGQWSSSRRTYRLGGGALDPG